MIVQQEFQAVVLAAGKGSRMPEIVADKPKCLLPIGSKPLIWYPLNKLQESGFSEAIVIVYASQASEIQACLDKTDLDLKIDYVSIDNDESGTADSLRHLQEKIKSDVIVISCDLITDIDLSKVVHMFRKNDASLCTLLFPPAQNEQIVVPGPKAKHKPERDLIGIDAQTNRLVFLASASDFESELTLSRNLVKKHTNIVMHSHLIDSHLYIMKNWLVKYLDHVSNISTLKGEFLPHIIKKQLTKRKQKQETNMSVTNTKDINDIFHYLHDNEVKSAIRDANSYTDHFGDMKAAFHDDLIRCYAYIAKPTHIGIRINTLPAFWSINGKINEYWERLAPNKSLNLLDPKADIKSNQVDKCFVWDSCQLNEKTSFKNSILASGTSVASFSRVFNSIVMSNVVIHEKSALESCIVCDGAVIEKNCQLKGCIVGSKHLVAEGSQHTSEVLTDSDKLMEF